MDKMTEQMAIEYGKDYLKDLICACCKVEDTHKEFVRLSIDALEKQSMVNEILNELQQYREIGTVREIKIKQAEMQVLSKRYLSDLGELMKYQSIGTVEECRDNNDFLEFLYNHIPPNEMEQYLHMYRTKEKIAVNGYADQGGLMSAT